MTQNYVILDLETTGLNNGLKLDEPVQIGILASDGTVLMNQLVMPTVAIDEEAIQTHGITLYKLLGAPTFLQILPTLNRLIEGMTVCIYNAAYDVRILLNAAHNCGVPLTRNFTVECVMTRYAEAWKQPNTHGFKSQKLIAAMEQQNLPVRSDAHDAIADCQMTLELKKLLDMGIGIKTFDPNAPQVVRLLSYEKKMTKTGKPYASFKCHDGQTLNVFDNQFGLFAGKGWDIQKSLTLMTEGEPRPLKMPVEVRIEPDGSYIKLAAVLTQNPNNVPAN